MTDRELLEMAAKAAGIRLHVWGTPGDENFADMDDGPYGRLWNPLTDDGDALRLAVKLRIKSRYNEALGQGLAWIGGDGFEARANIEECNKDECAATRRAIVRAAAEIGKAMA